MNYPHKVPVFTIRMEKELKDKLETIAIKQDVSMAEVVRQLVMSYDA